jgi:hypothetical protein
VTCDVLVPRHVFHLEEGIVCYAIQHKNEHRCQRHEIPLKPFSSNNNIPIQVGNSPLICFLHNGDKTTKSWSTCSNLLLCTHIVLKVLHTYPRWLEGPPASCVDNEKRYLHKMRSSINLMCQKKLRRTILSCVT